MLSALIAWHLWSELYFSAVSNIAMLETCKNWICPVNSCVYYAHQTRGIYQVLPYSEDSKALESTE